MRELARLSDLCWEGLTLKHITHRKIVFSYLLFIFMALLFEVFLVALFGFTMFLFFYCGLGPGFEFYISGVALILMVGLTALILGAVVKKMKVGF